MSKQLKQKKCRHCKELFTPFNSMAKACSPGCAVSLVRSEKQKEFNRVTREKKQSIKSRGGYAKDAQTAFNKYVRLRDSALPCISCNKHHSGQYHAGHYRTVGAHPELRFDERNCHKQCAPCNNHKSGNIVEYRINLLRRIGSDSLSVLEGPHKAKRYTIDDLIAIKAKYNAMYKELVSEQR